MGPPCAEAPRTVSDLLGLARAGATRHKSGRPPISSRLRRGRRNIRQPHWNPPTHVGFSRTPWFKVLAVGLVVLAVMPGSSASAKFETILPVRNHRGRRLLRFPKCDVRPQWDSREDRRCRRRTKQTPGILRHLAPRRRLPPFPTPRSAGPRARPPGRCARVRALDDARSRHAPFDPAAATRQRADAVADLRDLVDGPDRGRLVLGDRSLYRLVAGRAVRRHVARRLVADPGPVEAHGRHRHGRWPPVASLSSSRVWRSAACRCG